MLYMIGGTSEYSDDINGAVVNVRHRGDKICKFSPSHHTPFIQVCIENEKQF